LNKKCKQEFIKLNINFIIFNQKMKRAILLTAAAIFSFAIISCNSGSKNKAETGEAKEVTVTEGEQTLSIDSTDAIVEWEGYKPTGQHHGTINVSKGQIFMTDGALIGGNFTINMSSIKDLDLSDAEANAKLVGHLKSADFFDIEKYPTARFEITSANRVSNTNNYEVTGNLTMKDKTASVKFPASFVATGDSVVVNTPQFIIDRSVWDVRYGSRKFFDNLRDNYISDEIGLKVTIRKKVN
jgi:polyisoprenoid-binding protein YceI